MNLSKKLTFFLFFIFIVFGKMHAQNPIQGEYNFRNYTVENGLPSSETYDVKQDNEGNIWIATDRGVVKYDGQKFITYTKKDGLIDDVVLQIYKDRFGRMWFLSVSKGLCYYEKGKIIQYRFNNKIERARKKYSYIEKTIVVTRDSSLYYSLYNSGTIKIDKKGILSEIKQKPNSTHVFTIEDQKIWANKGGINGLNPDYSYKYPGRMLLYYHKGDIHSKEELIPIDINFETRIKLTETKANAFILCSNDIIDLTTKKKVTIPISKVIIHLNSIDDQIWVSELSSGIQMYRYVNNTPVFVKSVLNQYSVSSSFKDSKGGYWFTTLEAGVFYLPYFEIQTYTNKTGLISDEIKSLTGLDHSIYIGYNGFGVQKIQNFKITNYINNCQYTILGKVGKNIVLSDLEEGLFWNKKIVLDQWARDIYSTTNNAYAISNFLFNIDSKGNVKQIHSDIRFFEKVFLSIMVDQNNVIWLGDKEGLYFIKNKKICPFLPQTFKSRVNDLVYHPNWDQIIATKDAGLFLLKNKKIKKINGLLSKDIISLFVDSKNRLWVGTKKGVNILSKTKTGDIKIDCLSKNQGLFSNEITSIYVDDKNAWIGTKKGLSKVNLNYFSRQKGTYKIKLKSILLNDKSLDVSKELKIPYSEDVVKINFGTIDFITKGTYKYRLNSSSKWTHVSKPQIILINPEDGDYHLEASFLDENNVWSPIQNVASFEISPPFWRTIYFKILIILGIGYLIFLFIRYKKRQFETKQKLLVLEQKALFAQMNPHFIFNTLNSIQSFHLYNELDKAEYFLGKFSKLLRETLHVSRKASVSLKTEIGMLEKYLELEQMRFSNKFKWRIDSNINEQNLTLRIPSMLIQPYVENSIKHGFTEKRDDYEINIILTQVDELSLKCDVIDNGIGRSVSVQRKMENDSIKEHVSYGEKITKERLKSYNKRRTNLYQSTINDIIENDLSKGTKVEIIIPILK